MPTVKPVIKEYSTLISKLEVPIAKKITMHFFSVILVALASSALAIAKSMPQDEV